MDLRPLTGGVTPRKEWTKRPGCKASKCWHMKICRELTCSPFPGRALGVPSPVAGRVCTCCVPALQVQGPGWGLDTRVSLTILTAAQRAQGGGAVTQHSHSIISTDRHAAEDTYPLPQDLAGGSPPGVSPIPLSCRTSCGHSTAHMGNLASPPLTQQSCVDMCQRRVPKGTGGTQGHAP